VLHLIFEPAQEKIVNGLSTHAPLLSDGAQRDHVLQHLKSANVNAVFDYVPLHLLHEGMRFGRVNGDMVIW